MEPVVRALDVGFGHTKFVSSVDGSEVRCAHFPSVAYPTESDERTDPIGGKLIELPSKEWQELAEAA